MYDIRESKLELKPKSIDKEKIRNYSHDKEKAQKLNEEMALENEFGAVGFGTKKDLENQKNENLIVVSGMAQSQYAHTMDSKRVKESGAIKSKISHKQVVTNPHDKTNSAVLLSFKKEELSKKIVQNMQSLVESGKFNVLNEMLPFLDEKSTKQTIAKLVEKRHDKPSLDVQKERIIESLQNEQIKKEQQKRKFILQINNAINKKLQNKKQKHIAQDYYINLILNASTLKDDEQEEDNEENDEKGK